jgi:serine/threonine protein kinase
LIARWLFGTLQRLQKEGIVHRDIKPQNIIVGPNFELKLSDFGVAVVRPTPHNELLVADFRRMINPGSNKASVSTRDSIETQDGRGCEHAPDGVSAFPDEPLVGTFKYLSPEALQSSEALASSDVWAAAVTIHQLLTGKFPFEGDEENELTQMILKNAPRLDSSLSLSARTFLAAILLKDSARRLGHTSTVQIDFESILGHPFLKNSRDPTSPSNLKGVPEAPIRVCAAYWRWLGLLWSKVTLELYPCRIRVVKPPDKCLHSIALGDIERVEGLHSGRLRLVTSVREYAFDLQGEAPRDWVEDIARQLPTVC